MGRVGRSQMRERGVSLALLLLWLSMGCAANGEAPLNRVLLRASHPRSIALVRRVSPSPGFPRLRVCLGEGCTSSSLVAASELWNSARSLELRNSNAVEDPAVEIGEMLIAAMSKKYSMARVEGVVARAPMTAQDLSGSDYPQADLLLAIATTGWGFGPIGRGQSHVAYRSVLDLVDRRSRTVIARGVCTYNPIPSDDDPLYDDLVANNAALLKLQLHAIAEGCSDEYRHRILGIFP